MTDVFQIVGPRAHDQSGRELEKNGEINWAQEMKLQLSKFD